MTDVEMEKALNGGLYIYNPKKFAAVFEDVLNHLEEEEPTYGSRCVALMHKYNK